MPAIVDDLMVGIEVASALKKLVELEDGYFGILEGVPGKKIVGIDPATGNLMVDALGLPDPIPASTQVVATEKESPSGKKYMEYEFLEPPSDTIAKIANYPIADIPDTVDQTEMTKAVTITLNNLVKIDNGKTALDKAPAATKGAMNPDSIDSAYLAGDEYQKEFIADKAKKADVPLNPAAKKAFNATSKKQDGSRTSREHHEWKYCCVDSNNYSILLDIDNAKGLFYTGSDGVSTATGVSPSSGEVPPYHKWIEHEDLRKLCNQVKKIRRERGRCGGVKVLEIQGFASKYDAIRSDIETDATAQGLIANLIATGDFVAA